MKSTVLTVTSEEIGEEFDVEIRVYPDRSSLRRAARRYDRSHDGETDWSGTLGVCHCFETYHGPDYDERDPLVCIIRLNQEDLNPGVVAHEATHAAVYIHDLAFGDGIHNGQDEDLAWLVGEITYRMTNFIDREGL